MGFLIYSRRTSELDDFMNLELVDYPDLDTPRETHISLYNTSGRPGCGAVGIEDSDTDHLTRMLSSRFLISRPCCSFLTPHLTGSNQYRGKHSSRQVKRLFKNNPARARVEARMAVDHSPHPLEPAQFPPILANIKILQNGWSEPAPSRPEYPFHVRRTGNKPNNAVGFLPVYSKFR